MRSGHVGIGVIGLLALVGCGEDELSTKLEGVYQVSAWTLNQQGCDAEGASVAAGREPMLYLEADSFFGRGIVNIVACPDPAACTLQARDSELHLGDFVLDTGSDGAGWTSHVVGAAGSGGTCDGIVRDVTLTASGQMITIQQRTIELEPFTGECTIEEAEAAAAGRPCSNLEVVHATLTAKF